MMAQAQYKTVRWGVIGARAAVLVLVALTVILGALCINAVSG